MHLNGNLPIQGIHKPRGATRWDVGLTQGAEAQISTLRVGTRLWLLVSLPSTHSCPALRAEAWCGVERPPFVAHLFSSVSAFTFAQWEEGVKKRKTNQGTFNCSWQEKCVLHH